MLRERESDRSGRVSSPGGTTDHPDDAAFEPSFLLSLMSLRKKYADDYLLLLARSLLPGYRLFYTAARARIRACALSPAWQIAPVAQASIAANLHEAFDIHVYFAPQISFDATVALNVIPQGDQFIRVQIIDAFVLVNPRRLQNLLADRTADPVNVG